jgi:hypothetical protein
MASTFVLKEDTDILGPHGQVIATLRPIFNGDGIEVEVSEKAIAVQQESRQRENGERQVFHFFLGLDTSDWAEVLYGIY